MKQYLEVQKADGVDRVEMREFRGHTFLDVRHYFERAPGEVVPTKKGVTFNVRDVPRLRAALEAAERDALWQGLLEEQDYELAGLPVPSSMNENAKG